MPRSCGLVGSLHSVPSMNALPTSSKWLTSCGVNPPASGDCCGGNSHERELIVLKVRHRKISLPTGHIYPKKQRAVRDLLRQRSRLMQQRTAHVLNVKSTYARQLNIRV